MSSEIRDIYQRRRTLFVTIIVAACVLATMIVRQPDQWAHPYIWAEDGNVNLPDFAAYGWVSVFRPFTGYLLVPTKFILALSATLSFRWLPEIGYWLTLSLTACVLLAIALSPTTLRLRLPCAIAPLLLPLEPEIYGIPVLTLWWGSLFAAIPLLWRADRERGKIWQILFLTVGGLSSPLIVFLLPLYALKAYIAVWGSDEHRSGLHHGIKAISNSASQLSGLPNPKEEALTLSDRRAANTFRILDILKRPQSINFLVACVVAGFQLAAYIATRHLLPVSRPGGPGFSISLFVPKFFGSFVFAAPPGWEYFLSILGCGLFAFLIVSGIRYRHSVTPTYYGLIAMFFLATMTTVLRLPLNSINTQGAGTRYFFFPFVFLSWSILQLVAIPKALPRYVSIAILVLAFCSTLDIGRRRNDFIDWRSNVASCASQNGYYDLPIHTNGNSANIWHARMKGDTCRELIKKSWFDNKATAAGATGNHLDGRSESNIAVVASHNSCGEMDGSRMPSQFALQ